MISQEQAVIADLKDLAAQGRLSPYELDWCIGAVRNRLGLSTETRHQLRDTVHDILKKAAQRSAEQQESQ